MNKELASIQEIKSVKTHPNAERLDIVKILGWNVVTKKGEFKAGDKCVYIGLDSVVPKENPAFEFLKNSGYRIRYTKLRKVMSCGIALPLSVLGVDGDIGKDVSKELGITKFFKPAPLTGDVKGDFPTSIIKKTDEIRLQNYPEALDIFKGKSVHITAKADGSSMTVYKKNNKLHVCSRNNELKEPKSPISLAFSRAKESLKKGKIPTLKNLFKPQKISNFWKMVDKYNLQNIPNGSVVQAEVIGVGIQKNPHKIDDVRIKVFNVFTLVGDETMARDTTYGFMDLFCSCYNLPMCDLVYSGKWEGLGLNTIEELEQYADTIKYKEFKSPAEGIVIRTSNPEYDERLNKSISVKVISPKYALKHGE